MRSNESYEHGGDPDDEIHSLRPTPAQAEDKNRDWNKVYQSTKGAAALVLENLEWGVTHD